MFLAVLKSVVIIILFLLWQYSLAYACLKLVNYSFFFWLPFYLSNNFGWKEAEADRLSVWYDVGGIIGEWQWGHALTLHFLNLIEKKIENLFTLILIFIVNV